jgi:hypothetical protein
MELSPAPTLGLCSSRALHREELSSAAAAAFMRTYLDGMYEFQCCNALYLEIEIGIFVPFAMLNPAVVIESIAEESD